MLESAVVGSPSQARDPSDERGEGRFPQVFGKYVLLRPMARGGMGELFLAAHGETGGFEKLCVVKKVLNSLQDAGVHRRFLDEAKVVVRLNHGNLVQVFDAGRVNAEHYLAMELVEGKDLRAVWNRCAQLHRRIPVDVAIYVVRELARGLDYVHNAMSLDLVHRDISPPNILIGYHGEVKITDFGLAKSAIKREMTSPGVVFGRYSYLSPEQARGMPADRRTDIYAAGIVLWELLTGRQLFPSTDRTHQEALAAVRDPKVVPPSKVVPGIPPGLDETALKALARERDDRFRAAAEFRDALSEVLSGHFPACNTDRISEFMRDIFAAEIKSETSDYAGLAREDFSEIRSHADISDAISISDVILIEEGPGIDSSTIQLDDADIVELEEVERKEWAHELKPEALRAAAQKWVGKVVARRYRIDALLGVGGMGAVFRGTHLALGKTFALKILHRMYTRDPQIVARFMREARAATQTGHPNIIDVVDVGTMESGGVFSVMELLEGENLASTIERDGTMAIRRAVHVARQMCRALAAAHAVGIIHRDLKSDNVFLIRRGRDPDFVKVLDFGICKQVDADTTTTSPGIVMGSPGYMAPEQAARSEATVASDIYALGTVLFEMLTGVLPYEGRFALEVLMKKNSQDAPRVTTLRAEVPEALADVVVRCIARRPEDRPVSMRALEYELTRAVDGRASAVAAVLGLDVAVDPDAQDSSEAPVPALSSRSLARAPVMPAAFGVPARSPAQESSAPLLGRAPARREGRGLAAGAKAFFFVLLGGAVAAALIVRGMDELVPSSNRSAPSLVQPTPAVPAPEAAQPVPAPAPAPAPVPAPAPGVNDSKSIVARADAALRAEHWIDPLEGSLALELKQLSLVDPGNVAIAKLRRQAEGVLLPRAGLAFRRKGWTDAAAAYRSLVAVWPEHEEGRTRLIETLASLSTQQIGRKDFGGALATAREHLNYVPGDFDATMIVADSLAGLKRWAEARDAYGVAKKLKPRSRAAKAGFAKAKSQLRRASKKP